MAEVIVIDDSPEQLHLLQRVVSLVDGKPKCLAANSPEQGIRLLNRVDPDPLTVVVTDLVFEGRPEGARVVQEAGEIGRRTGRFVPVIVVTVFSDPISMKKAMEAGAFDWIDLENTAQDSKSLLKYKIEWALRFAEAKNVGASDLVSQR